MAPRALCLQGREWTADMARETAERRHPRKAVRRAYVEYAKSGTRLSRLFRSEILRGPMVDVGKNGVQFRTTEPLEEGDAIFMTLRFSHMREPIRLKAEVRWVREEKKVGIENYTHVVGVEFKEYTSRGWDLIQTAMRD